jgi:hypothetical protein
MDACSSRGEFRRGARANERECTGIGFLEPAFGQRFRAALCSHLLWRARRGLRLGLRRHIGMPVLLRLAVLYRPMSNRG